MEAINLQIMPTIFNHSISLTQCHVRSQLLMNFFFFRFAIVGNMMKVLRGHQNWVYCSAFSPDSSVLCSVGAGKAVRTSQSNFLIGCTVCVLSITACN